MAYTAFDATKPDAATQNGTQFAQAIRNNQAAMRDAIVTGSMPGFNYSVSGGTPEQPAIIYYKKGADWVRITLTWGTTGGADGNVTVAVLASSANSGGVYDTIGTQTMTYDLNGNVTATNWS